MTRNAAFQAVYTNFKTVPSRKVVQVTLEAPMEAGDSIIAILGMPNPEVSKWLGVALLKQIPAPADASVVGGDTPVADGVHDPAPQQPESKSWREMSHAQRAGILCNEPRFHEFLVSKYPLCKTPYERSPAESAPHAAARILRDSCDVKSRSEILPGTEAAKVFEQIDGDYRAWLKYGARI